MHQSLKRFSVLVVHRRGGKTVLSINTLIRAGLTCKKQLARFGYIAPYLKQARQIAWDYMKHFTADLPGVSYNEQLMQVTLPNGARIQIFGADNPDALRGMYFDGVVLDEVADMKPSVWVEIIRPALADRLGWALFIGTPKGLNLFSQVYFMALTDEDWFTAVYTCYDTDSLAPEEIARAKKEMPAAKFAQEMLCDFHAAVENALISIDKAQAAMDRVIHPRDYVEAARTMGVDVARYGDDRSSIVRRQGLGGLGHKVLRNQSTGDLVGQAALVADKFDPDMIFVDIGYNPGVYDGINDLGFPCTGVDFGGKALDARFENKRAEMWWNMAEWLAHGSIPRDHALLTDLCAPLYTFSNVKGRIQLESKDKLRERGLPSPDIGDGYALTFAHPVAPRTVMLPGQERFNREQQDYDPHGGM